MSDSRISLILIVLITICLTACSKSSFDFYPIGIYTVLDEIAFMDARDAGFNTVVVYNTNHDEISAAVRMAENYSLKLVCYPGEYPRLDGSFDGEAVASTLEKLLYEESLLAWYLYDEPESTGLRADHLRNYHLYIRERSRKIPTAFAIGDGGQYHTYARCSNIVMLDWYPIPLHPMESISEHILMCKRYLSKDQHLWMIIQAFDWNFFSQRVLELGTGRIPTINEMRFMSFLAVAMKVDGVFFWSYETPKGEWSIKEYPQLWEDLLQLIEELKMIYPFLIAQPDCTNVYHRTCSLERNNAIHVLIKQVHWKDYSRAGKTTGKRSSMIKPGRYALVVNAGGPEIEITLDGISSEAKNATEIFSGKSNRIYAGKMKTRLLPYDVKLYRLGL